MMKHKLSLVCIFHDIVIRLKLLCYLPTLIDSLLRLLLLLVLQQVRRWNPSKWRMIMVIYAHETCVQSSLFLTHCNQKMMIECQLIPILAHIALVAILSMLACHGLICLSPLLNDIKMLPPPHLHCLQHLHPQHLLWWLLLLPLVVVCGCLQLHFTRWRVIILSIIIIQVPLMWLFMVNILFLHHIHHLLVLRHL